MKYKEIIQLYPAHMEMRAFALAASKHALEGQVRKYTNVPYIIHPVAVAHNLRRFGITHPTDISAAYCHDLIEDTGTTAEEIAELINADVAELVVELTKITKPELGNRLARHRIEKERLSKVSDRAKAIKLADLIDNTTDIVEHDPKFAVIYLEEKKDLLTVLTPDKATREFGYLYNEANRVLEKGLRKIYGYPL